MTEETAARPGGAGGTAPGARLLKDHPLRVTLTNEVHARPPELLRPPTRGTLLAMFSGEGTTGDDLSHLARLCAWAGVPPPAPDATHYSGSFGSFRLKWERHTEFSTWSVFRPTAPAAALDPFLEPALDAVPRDWLAALPGELMAGIHIVVLDNGAPVPTPETLEAIFGSDRYVGSRVAGGTATAWTDFRIHGDNFSRILVVDHSMTGNQTGRTVQRLFEIETYRIMALMALPEARRALPDIGRIEAELAELTGRMAAIEGLEDERDLLGRLTRLAARTEQISAETAYRFGAARAYYLLVRKRIEELREVRIEGVPMIAEFMERRLAPALRTCEAAQTRLEMLSQRVARASNLLRTRVEIAVEGQNAELLRSMDSRAHAQLRLQETVEGLSVVAISYYGVGILGYAAKALKGMGVPLNPDLVTGIGIPVVLFAVWTGVRRIRRVLVEPSDAPHG